MRTGDAHVEDDGIVVTAIEAGDAPQSVTVRVGPAFYGNGETGRAVWIEYQERHMASLPAGPVLLSISAWRELVAAVEKKL